MATNLFITQRPWRGLLALACLLLVAGCATQPPGRPEDAASARALREARSTSVPVEKRAADYLEAAAMTAPLLGPEKADTAAQSTYNSAAAELAVLLRNTDGGRLWNQPLTVTSSDQSYHLRLQPQSAANWSPDYFTHFLLPGDIKRPSAKSQILVPGIGGPLVGVRQTNPRENFASLKGLSAPVTATLDFKGKDATLALRRPGKQPGATVEGKTHPLAADYSAPLSYYSPPSPLIGIMAALRSARYLEKTGLYFLQPYDPERIPVVFIHGLISTPFTWVQTINGLEQDPEIRKRYQFWVFAYPTGMPVLYSALRLREELAKVDRVYPHHRPYVLVGHSMGGMLAHAQVVTVTPEMWTKDYGQVAANILRRNSPSSALVRSVVFHANPRVSRVVFICTPHRGSELATGRLGKLAISLISVPVNVALTMKDALTASELRQLTGSEDRLPNSVWGLRPGNPSFKVLNSARITVPYHSIIGDRGRHDTPNSSDGVVPYPSSHLDGARSEAIVPGPHSSTGLPQTISELDRILRLNLDGRALSSADE